METHVVANTPPPPPPPPTEQKQKPANQPQIL